MSERPDARDLLIVAREELVKSLLPKLPDELRYQALMIANAMAIAAREFENGLEHDQRELDSLFQLLSNTEPATNVSANEKSPAVAGSEMARMLQTFRKQLGNKIRAGDFDASAPAHRAMLNHLKTTARDKLAISNPKLLK